ncbi:uncharacterized protein JCM10292_001983 [Rhodotorula paludigena]|uniref:uncharacterized protein n=1 Tax=Rhodotorula paludigena TaxID=86838 RepID=UPI00317FC9EB
MSGESPEDAGRPLAKEPPLTEFLLSALRVSPSSSGLSFAPEQQHAQPAPEPQQQQAAALEPAARTPKPRRSLSSLLLLASPARVASSSASTHLDPPHAHEQPGPHEHGTGARSLAASPLLTLATGDELDSPLEAPALPFSTRSRRSSVSSAGAPTSPAQYTPHSRPSSALAYASPSTLSLASSSVDSLVSRPTSPRVELAGSPSLPPGLAFAVNMRGYDDDANGQAQEELLDADELDRKGYQDPYTWERPLEAVNRHSRLLDSAPISTSPGSAHGADGRRLSRLPPGVSLLDPFGFNLSNDASPYDPAYAYSAAAQAPGMTAGTPPRSPARGSFLGPQGAGSAVTASPVPGASSSFTPPPPQQPWVKPRASSAGEQGFNRSQLRNGLLAPGMSPGASPRQSVTGRSKLSGEIDADAMSIASTSRQPAQPIPGVPTDADYLNSKLYQRTLKAQKALDKERAKAASKGKLSRYDAQASKSTSSLASTTSTTGAGFSAFGLGGLAHRRRSTESSRPPSIMSAAGVSGTTSAKRGGRKGLGWFRSSSEAALAHLPEVDLPIIDVPGGGTFRASKSSSQISTMRPRRTSSGGTTSGQPSPSLSVSPGGSIASGGAAGGAHGQGPMLPPSPNLPSEATLRAMGVSTDQLRAAAQVQSGPTPPLPVTAAGASQRPRSSGRQNSGGSMPGQKRSPAPSPRLDQTASAFAPSPQTAPAAVALRQTSLPPGPPSPVPEQPEPQQAIEPKRPAAPPRGASLETSAPTAAPTSGSSSTPTPAPSTSLPPRTASRSAAPENIPLPPSAAPTPTRNEFPPSATSPPPAPTRAAPAPPSSTLPPIADAPAPRPLAASVPASMGASPPDIAPSSAGLAAPVPQVKRRKSGLGLLFGGSRSGSSSGSATPEREQSPTPSSSGASSATARQEQEKERMLRRMEERQVEQRQQQQQQQQGAKLVKEKTGGFFGRSGKPRASMPAPSGPSAPVPPKGAAPPVKTKKEPAPFFHPSQAIHHQQSSAPASPQQPIRAVNPSPVIPQQPHAAARQHQSSHAAHDPAAMRADSSSGSSTTYSSLSSSSSTLPPPTPAGNKPLPLDAAPQLAPKKSGFASLFSSYGSVRGRTKSSPAPPTTTAKVMAQPATAGHDLKTLPVLPQAPPPALSNGTLRKPPRGQSLGAQAQPQSTGQQQARLASKQPYPTYA